MDDTIYYTIVDFYDKNHYQTRILTLEEIESFFEFLEVGEAPQEYLPFPLAWSDTIDDEEFLNQFTFH